MLSANKTMCNKMYARRTSSFSQLKTQCRNATVGNMTFFRVPANIKHIHDRHFLNTVKAQIASIAI